jgi:hypothetical protein
VRGRQPPGIFERVPDRDEPEGVGDGTSCLREPAASVAETRPNAPNATRPRHATTAVTTPLSPPLRWFVFPSADNQAPLAAVIPPAHRHDRYSITPQRGEATVTPTCVSVETGRRMRHVL